MESPLFAAVWTVYGASFPAMERRTLAGQRLAMANPRYRLDAWHEDGRFTGFMGWWDFGTFRFVEHLATDPSARSGGVGSRILKQWMESEKTPVILEIDPPEDDISRRRLGFYRRLGCVENPMEHSHPYYQGTPAPNAPQRVPLRVLSWPRAITDAEYRDFFGANQREVWASIGV